MILSVRSHGETAALISLLAVEKGLWRGIVPGGRGRSLRPVLQPGTEVEAEWSARLESHLGQFRIEPIKAHGTSLMEDRWALAGMTSVLALADRAYQERDPLPQSDGEAGVGALLTLFGLLDLSRQAEDPLPGGAAIALWERDLLAMGGFGLDLSRCAVTGLGAADGVVLSHVSPRSGRAVSEGQTGPWLDRLLPLPPFLAQGSLPTAEEGANAIHQALSLTGHFLPRVVGEPLPRARVDYAARWARQAEANTPQI